jgi:hypothetical protein
MGMLILWMIGCEHHSPLTFEPFPYAFPQPVEIRPASRDLSEIRGLLLQVASELLQDRRIVDREEIGKPPVSGSAKDRAMLEDGLVLAVAEAALSAAHQLLPAPLDLIARRTGKTGNRGRLPVQIPEIRLGTLERDIYPE